MTDTHKSNLQQVQDIAALSDGWNGEGSFAFSPAFISIAQTLVGTLTRPTIILPTGRDSIQMEYEHANGDYLEFELFPDSTLKQFSLTHDGKSSEKAISFASMNKAVIEFYG